MIRFYHNRSTIRIILELLKTIKHSKHLSFNFGVACLCVQKQLTCKLHWTLSCKRTAPMPRCEASTWMMTDLVLSRYCSDVGAGIAFLILSTADWCSGLLTNSLVVLVGAHGSAANVLDKSGINRLGNCTIPRNVRRSDMLFFLFRLRFSLPKNLRLQR